MEEYKKQIMKFKKIILALLIMITSIGIITSPVFAADVNVDNTKTLADIQTLIDGASAGDNIIFATGLYDFGNDSIGLTITKALNFIGNGAQIFMNATDNTTEATLFTLDSLAGNDASNTNISGFTFNISTEDKAKKKLGSGITITSGTANVNITNCTFIDGANGIDLNGAINTSITQNNFTLNKKAINIMGGDYYYVAENFFNDVKWDGLSIASGASNVNVTKNIFNDTDEYDIFIGGGVTNTSFTENIFNAWGLNSISLVKSADHVVIDNNNFTNGGDGAINIASDKSHGYPSVINAVNITNNLFKNIAAQTTGKLGYLNGSAITIDGNRDTSARVALTTGDEGIFINNNTVDNVTNGLFKNMGLTGVNTAILAGNFDEATGTSNGVIVKALTPALSLDILAPTTNVRNGLTQTYTYTVTNTGKGTAKDVVANNLFDKTGFTGKIALGNGNLTGNTWNIGDLAAGQSKTLILTLTAIKSGTYNTVATVSSTSQDGLVKTKTVTKTVNKYINLGYKYSASTKVKRNKKATVKTVIKNTGRDTSAPVTVKYVASKNLGKKSKTYTWTSKAYTIGAGASKTYTATFKMYTKGYKYVKIYVKQGNGKYVYKGQKRIRGY